MTNAEFLGLLILLALVVGYLAGKVQGQLDERERTTRFLDSLSDKGKQ